MTEVLYASSFFDEMAQVETKRVRDNIMDATDLLAVIPEMGSTNPPASIVEKYDDDVRKLVVPVAVERHHRNPARTFRKRRRSSEQRGKDSRSDYFHFPLHSLKTDGSTISGFFPSGAVT